MTNLDWTNFNSSLIIEVTRKDGIFTCTGVAINSSTVLTAAHCLEGDIIKIRVSNDSQYDPNGSFYEVEYYELHPDYNYNKSKYRCDLAKIKLKVPLPQETTFFPILKHTNEINGKIIRLGFGGRSNQNIRTLITPSFKDVSSIDNVLELHDNYSFSGDSGGPVFLQKNGQMYLIAIHSTLSFGPDGKYSFNPILSSHRHWINS